MVATGISDSEHKALLELKSGVSRFLDNICRLSNYGQSRSLLNEGKMETGGGSTSGESLQSSTYETSPVRAVSPPMPLAPGGSMGGYSPTIGDKVIPDAGVGRSEKMQGLAGAIRPQYEAYIAKRLEDEKNQTEAEVGLRFAFDFEMLGRDIDELRRELRRIVSSFSPEDRDLRRSMLMLSREPCLSGVAKLRWISEQISMLRRLDLNLDSEVKSTMLKLKTESYLSSIEKEEGSSGKEVAGDEETFAAYRRCWERTWGDDFSFEDQTLLSPMQYTHCKPSRVPTDAVAGSTMQIYSIKISAKGFKWPQPVYGVVTARDSVDRQRNPLFVRTRNYCQVVTADNPFLRLTGPVRAIVSSRGTVYIETELKIRGTRKSEDIVLASTVINSYNGDEFSISLADNKLCTIDLCFQKLEHSVQATIVSIVVESKPGSAPFPHGGKITCSSLPCSGIGDFARIPSRQAVLFDSVNGELIKDRAGHLDLNRRVLSVELGGNLQFHIKRYSQQGSSEIDPRVLLFPPKRWNISKDECYLDDGSRVLITVAWSLVPSKMLTS